nr:Suppressor of G2 allele of SKP1 [Hymenolepis microstoma]
MSDFDSGYQWFQTDSTVYVSVLRKGVDPNTLHIEFDTKSVTISINGEITNNINLAHPIDPTKSSFKCTSMKIELKLAKTESFHWSCLEGVDSMASLKVIDAPAATPNDGDKPKAVKSARNWDALAKEADEIEEGDPLNKLFQKIYSEADENTRRAMMKSFVESNGTVLSTNWEEVGKGKVEMKPPDGMEFKEYAK